MNIGTSRVFTCFQYLHIEKTAPPRCSLVFSPLWTIFELFHDEWAKIITSRVFTRNTALRHSRHVFQRTYLDHPCPHYPPRGTTNIGLLIIYYATWRKNGSIS
ncbi:hypothetical protein DPMN_047907 [Dreissena polymorpha]|uniref:Uncharacterized protein n=1 Tax=Dreissena polymorpha TaxID=45954 RepID=A0A9D4I2C1_DREPO|nr:hypothetical protein DPMN_047907 [Dreissena polymorpha]